jgi:mRNA interferase MazF
VAGVKGESGGTKKPAKRKPAKPPARPALVKRGELWWADLEPTRGREQQKTRPVLVVSINWLNLSAADLVIALPLTSVDRGIRSHVPIGTEGTGLQSESFIMCEQIRVLSKERLVRAIGTAPDETMKAIEKPLRFLLGLGLGL